MEPQELTTGNVVGVTHDKWGGMPAIVTSINIEGDLSLRLLGVPRAYEEYKCVLTEVFPVRISEKFLLRNGFIFSFDQMIIGQKPDQTDSQGCNRSEQEGKAECPEQIKQ